MWWTSDGSSGGSDCDEVRSDGQNASGSSNQAPRLNSSRVTGRVAA